MSRVIISILSEHLVPNFLFIKEVANDDDILVLISTEYTQKQNIAERLEKALGLQSNDIERVQVQNDDFDHTMKALEAADFNWQDEYIVNLTGGTKIMSIATYEFFKDMRDSHQAKVRFVYVPFGDNSYCNLDDEQSHPFTTQITLKEYFYMYGINYQSETNLLKSENTTFDLFNKVKQKNFILLGKMRHSQELPDNKDKRYYGGEWFEEYTYLRVKKELKLGEEQIAHSLKIFREGEEQSTNDNELDVAFVYQNRLYVMECKTAMRGRMGSEGTIEETLYKLAAVIKNYGLKVKSYLVTLHSPAKLTTQGVKKRREILGISGIIDRSALSAARLQL